MRVIVLADTHMPKHGRSFPRELLAALSGADMIVHLGDFTSFDVVGMLREYNVPLRGVHGNNDDHDVVSLFPPRDRLRINNHVISLIHGHIGGKTAEAAARAVQGGDAVLFGHSHRATSLVENGRLFFNPGSPTDRRWTAHHSFGVLDVSEDGILPNLIVCGQTVD